MYTYVSTERSGRRVLPSTLQPSNSLTTSNVACPARPFSPSTQILSIKGYNHMTWFKRVRQALAWLEKAVGSVRHSLARFAPTRSLTQPPFCFCTTLSATGYGCFLRKVEPTSSLQSSRCCCGTYCPAASSPRRQTTAKTAATRATTATTATTEARTTARTTPRTAMRDPTKRQQQQQLQRQTQFQNRLQVSWHAQCDLPCMFHPSHCPSP